MNNPVNDDRHPLVGDWDIEDMGEYDWRTQQYVYLKRPILTPTYWVTTPVPIDEWLFKFLRGSAYDDKARFMRIDQEYISLPISLGDGYEGVVWGAKSSGFRICRNKQ